MKAPVPQSDFKPAPSGAHPAILVQLVDFGTEEAEYNGKVKHQRKVRMVFELHSPEAKMEDGKPMLVGRKFTLSSFESAALRQFIEGWRGVAFTDDEAAEFDYQKMLGKPCLLNIKHDTHGGKTYANLDSAMRLPSGMPVPTQVNPSVYFYMGTAESAYAEFNSAVFDGLSDWMKEAIRKSPEYLAATGQTPPQAAAAPAPKADEAFSDEIPF